MTSTGTCCTILTSALECVVNVVPAARKTAGAMRWDAGVWLMLWAHVQRCVKA